MVKQYQTFILDRDLNPVVKKGMTGVILEIYNDNAFEVEFVNDNGINFEYDGQFTFTIDSTYVAQL